MLLPPLVRKSWRDDRRSVLGWAVGVTVFTLVYAGFYQQLKGAAELKQQALPQGMLDFLGVPDLVSPAGYLQASIFSLLGPLLTLFCTITLTARTIPRPEEDGGMELLLTVPVSRTRFAGQRLAAAAAVATGIAALPGIVLLIVVAGTGMDITWSNVTAASTGLVALTWCFGGIAFLAGAVSGRRATVLAVTGTLAVATYMAQALSDMAGGLHWLRWLSPFHYYIGTDPLHTGWHPAHLLTLVAVGAGSAIAGVIRFDRRDVGV
ncbi:ABC transporter permease [Actinoplanes ianthinogenes]|uniref:ABC transporter permease n=1 Tax=Actinoplanes ianthinogenes TaxID=122358 RepID=A0ABN6CS62_9ACTN|nr:ABC transporter permease subunit [Actinoplanes ianthinogenes]BCJ47960.1 ABC transporter permease [Actinoplanes ianthinogenes]GGR05369.1 ABC transporter permease [Actinoplanes ianthinogenes]